MSPVTRVDIAPQRNQKSAVGAITFDTAGFCSSGIFGIDGVCTKLKYQSRPIHITPESTGSQRMKKVHPAWSPARIQLPVPRPAMMMKMRRRTTPAVIVRPRDEKIAPMFSPFCSDAFSGEKSLALLSYARTMTRLAANLSTLFTEVDFPERFAAAARAGFRYVEYQFPYQWKPDELAKRAGE